MRTVFFLSECFQVVCLPNLDIVSVSKYLNDSPVAVMFYRYLCCLLAQTRIDFRDDCSEL